MNDTNDTIRRMHSGLNPLSQRERELLRRGNTIVLVTGILVLLVIIATAYVTSTQAGRTSAGSYLSKGHRDGNKEVIAEELANEVALSLFVREVAFNSTPNGVPSSNDPRLLVKHDALRYGSDLNFKFNFASFHVAPWTNWPDADLSNTFLLNPNLWPKGLGNTTGGGILPLDQAILGSEDNPYGNPGFGDMRWGRDIEPLRYDSNGDFIPDAFSHWRHISNIARPDNAWRIVRNIDNIDSPGVLVTDLNLPVEQWLAMAPDQSRYGSNSGNPTATAIFPGQVSFENQWVMWFGGNNPNATTAQKLENHRLVMSDPFNVPHNYYRLSDLNGNGIRHEIGERPQDEFIVGTARWNVSRVLCDTDGDGFTDSFWLLAPTSSQSATRQIVGVSIIDNGGMANANVWTRFIRGEFTIDSNLNLVQMNPLNTPKKTAGLHPGELALVGNLFTQSPYPTHWGHWNTGVLDCPEHQYTVVGVNDPEPWAFPPGAGTEYFVLQYDTSLDNTQSGANLRPWQRHLFELGFATSAIPTPSIVRPAIDNRLDFWRRAGSRNLLGPDANSSYVPFSFGDELELRMYSGQNSPWTFTRFEYATQDLNAGAYGRFLRGLGYEESNEYYEQRTNRKNLIDFRHRLTLFNGARNDLMPQWTWTFDPRFRYSDINGDGVFDWTAANSIDRALFERGMRKFDLRLGPVANPIGRFFSNFYSFAPADYTTNITDYNWKFGIALRDHLEHVLMDSQPQLPDIGTYFGNDPGAQTTNQVKSRHLSSAYAANIAQSRDNDHVTYLEETMPVSDGSTQNRYMGMEPQPFLVEAFIGHIYKAIKVDAPSPTAPPDYANAGHNVVTDDTDRYSTVVVVQIANPYNIPIDLKDFRISVFGQNFQLWDPSLNLPIENRYLLPATPRAPTTAVYYAIREEFLDGVEGGHDPDPPINSAPPSPWFELPDLADRLEERWRDFLDIEVALSASDPLEDLPFGSIVVNVNNVVADTWEIENRGFYDGSNAEAVQLQRRMYASSTTPQVLANEHWVVVDRMDPTVNSNQRRFGDAVNELELDKPADVPEPPGIFSPDPLNPVYPGVDLGPATDVNNAGHYYTHWVQWTRATRAWGIDMDPQYDPTNNVTHYRYDPNEYNPRFVFGDRAVISSRDGTSSNEVDNGNKIRFRFDGPDPPLPPATTPAGPWFTRQYHPMLDLGGSGALATADRKPTFFDMNRRGDPINLPSNWTNNGWSYPDKGWYSQGTGPDTSPSQTSTAPDNMIRLKFPMQMLHKDADFEQVGELLNVWLFGHEVEINFAVDPPVYVKTETTFSEFMSQDKDNTGVEHLSQVGSGARVNRIRLTPTSPGLGQIVGVAISDQTDPFFRFEPRHAVPALPAALRLFDAFVCDGPGVNVVDNDNNGIINAADLALIQLQRLGNAKNFDGTATPGMINIGTAPQEVQRGAPHFYRLVHETGLALNPNNEVLKNAIGQDLVTTSFDPSALLPRTMIPESIVHFRECFNGLDPTNPANLNPTGIPFGANYQNRREMLGAAQASWIRGERGFATIGELLLMNRPGQGNVSGTPAIVRTTANPSVNDVIYNTYWQIDLNVTPSYNTGADASKPFWQAFASGDPVPRNFQSPMRVSVDRSSAPNLLGDLNGNNTQDWVEIRNNPNLDVNGNWIIDALESNPFSRLPHETAGDIEEANMLFAGASNLITTRSDVFTVYFRIRSFRQNTSVNPPVWDATNQEYIIDDSRYVMLVDRSNVNKPSDRPRILYMEKLPN